MAGESFDGIWNDPPFHFQAEPPDAPCAFAKQFQNWVDTTFGEVLQEGDFTSLVQCKLFLLDRYFQFRASMPRRHRAPSPGRSGHTCIFEVFEASYNQLRFLELSLAPPPFARPAPHVRMPSPASSVLVGEIEPDPEFGEIIP